PPQAVHGDVQARGRPEVGALLQDDLRLGLPHRREGLRQRHQGVGAARPGEAHRLRPGRRHVVRAASARQVQVLTRRPLLRAGVPQGRMTRWALSVLMSMLLLGAAMMMAARLLGRSGSRGALVMSIVARWLGAYVLWSFVGGLALRYRVLTVYDGALFALLALGGGYWASATAVTRGRE